MKEKEVEMKRPKVAIVMSTYNGEKYLEEQLQSLFDQTYKNIQIYVRDDGSSDDTINILRKYEKKDNIQVIYGKNIGVTKSFLSALKIAYDNKNDYFAFCDQDDKWHKDKIERALNLIQQKENPTIPTMYFSEVNFCDENMNFIKKSSVGDSKLSFRNSLVDGAGYGMTSVYNKIMIKAILESDYNKVAQHDIWPYMIASGFGNIIYDSRATNEYRRTGNNVSPSGKSFFPLLVFRIKHFLTGDDSYLIKKQILLYKSNFFDKLKNEDKKLLNLFSEKYDFLKALKKTFYPKKFRENILDDFGVRFLFLIGKL